MAAQISSIMNGALRYPVVSCGLILLLAFPVFHLFVYFFPLFISTALCAAALLTAGPSFQSSEEAPAADNDVKYDNSWLGRIRCLQESAKVWLESKFRIRSRSDKSFQTEDQTEADECPEENVSVETEHEKRVHQLERTLRTLSFVSYEGIFASDGTLLDLEEDVNSSQESSAPPQAQDNAVETAVSSQKDDCTEESDEAPVEKPPSSAEQVGSLSDTNPQDSSSWQKVEHTDSEKIQ